jgi:hypothetical protein
MAFDSRPDLAGGASPKRFILYRLHDETGVSGTGVVATGVVWPDGHAAMRWKADDAAEASSTSVWSSLADLLRVHGHGGLSRIIYLDGDGAEERQQEPRPDTAPRRRGAGSEAVLHRHKPEAAGRWAWPH